MKNRILPLGYRMENGEIAIDEREAEGVKGIFNAYCSGCSLKFLVNDFNERNVVFKENGAQWNKGRIHHILTDRRYIGDKSFPPIIAVDVFDKANSLKDSKRTYQKPIIAEAEYLKEKIFCGKCGSRYIRLIDNAKKDRWKCSAGCKLGCRPTDEKLIAALQKIIIKISENPELLIQPITDAGYKRTPEIMRLTNEMLRMNEQIKPSFHTGKTLLFQIVARKFSACKEDKSIYTDYVITQAKRIMERGGVDVKFIDNAIQKILVTGKNEYAVIFTNGAVITNKEKTGKCKQNL